MKTIIIDMKKTHPLYNSYCKAGVVGDIHFFIDWAGNLGITPDTYALAQEFGLDRVKTIVDAKLVENLKETA